MSSRQINKLTRQNEQLTEQVTQLKVRVVELEIQLEGEKEQAKKYRGLLSKEREERRMQDYLREKRVKKALEAVLEAMVK